MMYYIDVYTTLYSESKDLDNLTTGKADFIAFTSQVRKPKYIQQLLASTLSRPGLGPETLKTN